MDHKAAFAAQTLSHTFQVTTIKRDSNYIVYDNILRKIIDKINKLRAFKHSQYSYVFVGCEVEKNRIE